jgi:hypothetical protein
MRTRPASRAYNNNNNNNYDE